MRYEDWIEFHVKTFYKQFIQYFKNNKFYLIEDEPRKKKHILHLCPYKHSFSIYWNHGKILLNSIIWKDFKEIFEKFIRIETPWVVSFFEFQEEKNDFIIVFSLQNKIINGIKDEDNMSLFWQKIHDSIEYSFLNIGYQIGEKMEKTILKRLIDDQKKYSSGIFWIKIYVDHQLYFFKNHFMDKLKELLRIQLCFIKAKYHIESISCQNMKKKTNKNEKYNENILEKCNSIYKYICSIFYYLEIRKNKVKYKKNDDTFSDLFRYNTSSCFEYTFYFKTKE